VVCRPCEGHRREVKGFDDDAWKRHRWEIVVSASVAKFSTNQALGSYLKATGSRVLAEASPVDLIWGIGLAADSQRSRTSMPGRA
jgi:ribA/ribD-fused uncharacterized protein